MTLLQIHEPGETPLPHAPGTAIGIDLGTTHSVAAIASEGVATLLTDADGDALVPSVVWYGGGKTFVGKSARAHLAKGDIGAVASIKRLMGRSRRDAEALKLTHPLGGEEDGMVRLEIGGQLRSPVEVSGEILRHLKVMAEATLGQDVTQAVITVPAYFDDAARAATKDAAKLAGLEVLRLINEPTAAALAYGLDHASEGVYAVYDLGGGTFDISILKLEKGVFQVLATGGDIALGGDDFDRAIVGALAPEARDPALLYAARKVKEALSDAKEATLEWQGKHRKFTQTDLEKLMQPYIAKTLVICAQALEDAKFGAKDIKGVVLVGGSTRTPYVRAQVEAFFGKPPLTDINPDEVVAVGAAIQAESLTQGGDHLLLDVVPLSLGLETMGGLVEKIIHRNTPIPVAAQQSFTTYKDGQNGMIVHVVQGEREMVDQNRSLARFELAGIPPLPAGIARVQVSFTVDADGMLSVSAREETTGVEQTVAVKPSYGLEEGEIERMLLESMEHARDDITLRLLQESKMEAGRSIEEVKSAFARDGDLLNPEEKKAIIRQMDVLEAVMTEEDRDRIDIEAQQLHTLTRPFAEMRMDRAINSALKGAHIDDAANG